jgi:hypothetical protein
MKQKHYSSSLEEDRRGSRYGGRLLLEQCHHTTLHHERGVVDPMYVGFMVVT